MDGDSVDIACPYLSIDIMEKIAELADSWRMITDTEEWVRTQSSREEIHEFIKENTENIHDCRNFHAKVIISEKSAIVGSANFTHTGLEKNTEMSVLLEQKSLLDELQNWFNELWSRTGPVEKDALNEYISKAEPANRKTGSKASMPDTGPSINTSLDFLKPNISVTKTGHDLLVDRVREAPGREWINTYFDWMEQLIEFTDLDEDNPSISTSVPISSPSRLPVSVNQRYVLTAFPKKGLVGIMLPADSKAVETLSEYISNFGIFSTSSDKDPYWFKFPGDPDDFITEEMKQDWKTAIKEELSRGSGSPHKRWHRSEAYKAAIDLQYRKEVLAEAFGPK